MSLVTEICRPVQFSERGTTILRDLRRFWALTVEQVALRQFGAVSSAAVVALR